MTVTNFHTHNNLCDGKGSIEEYIVCAVEKGLTALGFSSHAPLPVSNNWTLSDENLSVYLNQLEFQKKKWRESLQIYTGLEIDYIPDIQAPGNARWKALNLDYAIGSVHSTAGLDRNPEYKCVDGPLEDFLWLLEHIHTGSIQALCEAYYTRVCELVQIGGFNILGHLDLVKKRNLNSEFFEETQPWYRRQVLTALNVMAKSQIILEINSGAISRQVLEEVYPSPWIIAEAFKKNIPMMINSDAHQPQDVDFYFYESAELLRDIGCKEVWALLDNCWTAIKL
ncbi:MAG: hypothetical protein B0D92_02515 [Spirochaeta sp. LUC14_002_19_P3]|nr:MAG: hypothetical protein B0D92_02515 [Spirochaeta sp. LUC14_002_19_P3]